MVEDLAEIEGNGFEIELAGQEWAVDRRRAACTRMDQFFSIAALRAETL